MCVFSVFKCIQYPLYDRCMKIEPGIGNDNPIFITPVILSGIDAVPMKVTK